jgi:predicted DsbA family dithiol-disulfide isomerase
VLADRNLATQLGATGVPFFVFDMKFGISGAQPLEAFTQTLSQAWAEESNTLR